MKTKYVCDRCGSDKVEIKTWINANNGKVTVILIEVEEDDTWCPDCIRHVKLKVIEDD